MALFHVRLFGRFELSCTEDSSVALLNARRARELLCYLLLSGNRPQRRDALAALLWEDATPAQAGKYLRQALWQLQGALRPPADGTGPGVLEVDPEWIQLNRCDALRADVFDFEHAVRACHGVPGPLLDTAARSELEHAASLYRGELLEGWYQDWCMLARERLQNDFLDMLEKLVCACEWRGEGELGLAHARRMLALDPAREQVHRHVMRLHALSGNRTEALRHFERCKQTLTQELGVEPSHQTLALYESIRLGHSDVALEGPDPGHPDLPGAPQLSLAELLTRTQALLVCVESRLRQELAVPDRSPRQPD